MPFNQMVEGAQVEKMAVKEELSDMPLNQMVEGVQFEPMAVKEELPDTQFNQMDEDVPDEQKAVKEELTDAPYKQMVDGVLVEQTEVKEEVPDTQFNQMVEGVQVEQKDATKSDEESQTHCLKIEVVREDFPDCDHLHIKKEVDSTQMSADTLSEVKEEVPDTQFNQMVEGVQVEQKDATESDEESQTHCLKIEVVREDFPDCDHLHIKKEVDSTQMSADTLSGVDTFYDGIDTERKSNQEKEKTTDWRDTDAIYSQSSPFIEKSLCELCGAEFDKNYKCIECGRAFRDKGLDWSVEEQLQLLQALLKQCPDKDTVSFSTRASHLDWGSVQVGEHGIEDCKEQYLHLLSKVRKVRSLPEVLMAVKERIEELPTKNHPDQPVKPLTAFPKFVADHSKKVKSKHPELRGQDVMRHLGQMWQESPEIQNKYTKQYWKRRNLYLEESAKFREEHPELLEKKAAKHNPPKPPTPFLCFCDQKKPKLVAKHPELDALSLQNKLHRRYARLSSEKKMKWISRAKERLPLYQEQLEEYKLLHPDFQAPPVKVKLTIEERKISGEEDPEVLNKKPTNRKPVPPTPFLCFFYEKKLKLVVKHPELDVLSIRNNLRRKYALLSSEKKMKWISRAKEKLPLYQEQLEEYRLLHPNFKPPPVKVKLTIEERNISGECVKNGSYGWRNRMKKELPGQPVKPPKTAYRLYTKKQMEKNSSAKLTVVSQTWKTLSESEKNKYSKKLARLQRRYARELEEFKQTLTEGQLAFLEAQDTLKKENKAAASLKTKQRNQKTVVNDGHVAVGVEDVKKQRKQKTVVNDGHVSIGVEDDGHVSVGVEDV